LLLLAQKLPLGKYAGVVILYSGFFAMLMVAVKDFAGVMVVRFLYGFQVVGTPVNIIITAMWWRTEEQALRVAVWFAGAPFGALVGQAFSYGAVQIGGAFKDSPWKWIYILIGSISMAYSLVYLLLFPDSPMKCHFLTDRERHIAVLRVRSNNTGIQTRAWKLYQIWDAFKDPQLWLLVIIKFAIAFANTCFAK
jgi:MFS transporter, ACS family, allantoate permease